MEENWVVNELRLSFIAFPSNQFSPRNQGPWDKKGDDLLIKAVNVFCVTNKIISRMDVTNIVATRPLTLTSPCSTR